MLRWRQRHRSASWLMGIMLVVGLVIGGYFAKGAYDNYRVQRKIERALTRNGYPTSQRRSAVIREASGPFSGVSWYDYTFATPETLRLSQQYQLHQHGKKQAVTQENCPLVYRVILTPPTEKVARWSAVIYLDTNQPLRDSPTRSAAVQRLQEKTRRPFKLQPTDYR